MTSMNRALFKILFLLVLFNLSSCGFHLRGVVTSDMPTWLDYIYIDVKTANQDLKTRLIEKLQYTHRKVCYNLNDVKYILTIEQDEIFDNISSVSSATTPRQYQLVYRVWFNLTTPQGKVIIPSNHVSVSRTITINNDRILGSGQEEDLTKSSMREDAVLQILNTLKTKNYIE